MIIDAKNMELHLGILQTRMRELVAKLQGCNQKIILKEGDSPENYPDIDVETEKLLIEDLKQKIEALDLAATIYEDKVLELTQLA